MNKTYTPNVLTEKDIVFKEKINEIIDWINTQDKEKNGFAEGFFDSLKEGQEKYVDHSIDVRYEEDVLKAFDKFIKKWCGVSYPHLIDDDENDGQFMREKIESLLAKEPKEVKKCKHNCHEYRETCCADCDTKLACEDCRKGLPCYRHGSYPSPTTEPTDNLKDIEPVNKVWRASMGSWTYDWLVELTERINILSKGK